MNPTFEVTGSPAAEDVDLVGKRLAAFNDSDVGPADRTPLAVFLRGDGEAILGGLSGYTAWGWLYVQWLWVDETLRGRHVAGMMLETAEREATARGCHAAYIDTFNPQAAKAYERQGYRPFGTLLDFPVGRNRIFLQKRLNIAVA